MVKRLLAHADHHIVGQASARLIAENCGNVIPPTSKFRAYWRAVWSG